MIWSEVWTMFRWKPGLSFSQAWSLTVRLSVFGGGATCLIGGLKTGLKPM
jgi:hypothetical protein